MHWSTITLKTLTAQVNNIGQLDTVQRSAIKALILALIWIRLHGGPIGYQTRPLPVKTQSHYLWGVCLRS